VLRKETLVSLDNFIKRQVIISELKPMIGINEPEDPLFYNVLIDNVVDPSTKVEKLNKMIEKYFNNE
jgi:hypothetical protein